MRRPFREKKEVKRYRREINNPILQKNKKEFNKVKKIITKFNKKDELFLITGSPGGSQIPAANLRVVTGIIDFDLHIGDATMLPRIHKDWPYEDFEFESTLSQDNLNILDKMGHSLKPSDTIGSTQSIQIIDGINYGFADLRRPNSGVSVEKSSQ